jgi:hypothetical protein
MQEKLLLFMQIALALPMSEANMLGSAYELATFEPRRL